MCRICTPEAYGDDEALLAAAEKAAEEAAAADKLKIEMLRPHLTDEQARHYVVITREQEEQRQKLVTYLTHMWPNSSDWK